jgi:hypothetical protein
MIVQKERTQLPLCLYAQAIIEAMTNLQGIPAACLNKLATEYKKINKADWFQTKKNPADRFSKFTYFILHKQKNYSPSGRGFLPNIGKRRSIRSVVLSK